MEVEVGYRLAAIATNICHQSVGLETRLLKKMVRSGKDIRKEFRIVAVELSC